MLGTNAWSTAAVPITLISRQRLALSRSISSKGPKDPMPTLARPVDGARPESARDGVADLGVRQDRIIVENEDRTWS
jgi:hypothetical protein